MPRITQPEFLRALQVIYDETKTLRNVRKQLGASFLKAIDLLGNCQGRVVVTGIGKSGLVGRKIAATFPALALQHSLCTPGTLRTGTSVR